MFNIPLWLYIYPNSLGPRPVRICDIYPVFIFSKAHDLVRRANSLAFSGRDEFAKFFLILLQIRYTVVDLQTPYSLASLL